MNRPVLLVVDDDPLMLEWLVGALGDDYQVRPFASAIDALDRAGDMPPDAVVSDIVMPGVGGFEFRRRLCARYVDPPPFVFLSSVADVETTVAGLESGADDFIQKPTRPEILRARVAVALRRARNTRRRYSGDLAQTRFLDLLGFCEGQHFTGTLAVRGPAGVDVCLTVRGGHVDPTEGAEWIDRLCALDEGTFELRPSALSLDDLAPPSSQRPVGRVSAVRVRGRSLEVQTELLDGAPPTVVSVVLAGAEVVAKTKRPIDAQARGPLLQRHVDALHEETLAAMYDRVTALRHQHAGPPGDATVTPRPSPATTPARAADATPPVDVARLFDDGLDRSRRGDWSGALACWEQALAVDPDNKALAINVKVARRKTTPQ